MRLAAWLQSPGTLTSFLQPFEFLSVSKGVVWSGDRGASACCIETCNLPPHQAKNARARSIGCRAVYLSGSPARLALLYRVVEQRLYHGGCYADSRHATFIRYCPSNNLTASR